MTPVINSVILPAHAQATMAASCTSPLAGTGDQAFCATTTIDTVVANRGFWIDGSTCTLIEFDILNTTGTPPPGGVDYAYLRIERTAANQLPGFVGSSALGDVDGFQVPDCGETLNANLSNPFSYQITDSLSNAWTVSGVISLNLFANSVTVSQLDFTPL